MTGRPGAMCPGEGEMFNNPGLPVRRAQILAMKKKLVALAHHRVVAAWFGSYAYPYLYHVPCL